MSLFSLSLLFFLIMDPIGSVETVYRMTHALSSKRRLVFLVREMVFALGAMLLFLLIGEGLFSLLNLSEAAVSITAGIILFLFSVQVLFHRHKSLRAKTHESEPYLIPLAIPLVAGPALLMMILLFGHLDIGKWALFGAISIAWTISFAIFLFAPVFHRVLKVNGLLALEKLMAMVLILLAIQLFLNGVRQGVLGG